jgi:alkanesulfonate monooxygenase SsuD/methylene tetrahydromethanopterin reductase-like flavin-dependent oxidoreductase (luciferase family)
MPITITSTVDSLLQQLHTTLAGAVAKLEAERAALEADSQGILKTANELRLPLPAAAREAQRQADKLLLAGKPEEAAAKYAKQRQAESAPGKLEDRRRTIAVRIIEIASEKEAIARRCFAEWYPRLRAALVAEQLAMVDALDAAWTGIVRFSGETGTGGIGGVIKASMENDLTARDQGDERAIYGRLVDWFGGRQR